MKYIVLTGSTGGLGLELAKGLNGKEESNLICVYRNEEKFNRLISGEGVSCQGYCTNNHDDYSELCKMLTVEGTDELILILNAFTITPIKNIGSYSYDEIDMMIDGNLKTNIRIVNAITKWCKESNVLLRLINIDSGAADFPLKGWGNYGASKAYMNNFISVLQEENSSFKVVSFDPGVMDTKMQEEIRDTSSDVFNKVEDFINYKENGILKAPKDVAEEIINKYVNDWQAKELRE